jgi:hypothetical protein
VTELTDHDVFEMKQFLTGTCADIKRWLPEPGWSPGWQSDAAAERANDEHGPDGPWGPDIVRSVYVAAAMFLEAVLQCMRALAASITVDTTHYVPDCLARAAMESGSQAFWLLEPGIGARRRVARFMLIRAAGAQRRAEEVARTDPGQASLYGETPEQAAAVAVHYGLAAISAQTATPDLKGAARLVRDLFRVASGLLRDSAHLHQARSRCLRRCPGVTVTALGRPPHRAREGHGLRPDCD